MENTKLKQVEIIYQNYIPDDLIKEFVENLRPSINYVEKKEYNQRFSKFSGDEIADIFIFIGEDTTAFIVGSIVGPAVYGSLKFAIKTIWNGIKKLNILKLREGTQYTKQSNISLNFKVDKENTVEFNLSGEIDKEQIENITNKLFEFLKSNKKAECFDNPNYISKSEKETRIRLKYNNEKKEWEPIDFEEIRKEIKRIERWGEQHFSN